MESLGAVYILGVSTLEKHAINDPLAYRSKG